MFTGIIRELGTLERVQRTKGLVRLRIRAPRLAAQVRPLDSVSVNGVCFSAITAHRGTLTFEIIAETQRLTTLGSLRPDQRVHLEPSLTLADRLHGHLLLGHVDGRGRIVRRQQRAGELVLTIRTGRELARLLTTKGSVAVDGVSLTVARRLRSDRFTVHLIPETLRQTMLGERPVGTDVNLELDYLAKLVWQFLRLR